MKGNISIVGGCGHVGLPLGLLFAAKDYDVTLIDMNIAAVSAVNTGYVPFMERGAQELLKEIRMSKGNIRAVPWMEAAKLSDTVIFVTGTPVDSHLNPDTRKFDAVIEQYAPHIKEGALVVFRSTVYPGTTDRLIQKYPQFSIVFCPERISQGHSLEEMPEIPQIVGANTEEDFLRASALFSDISPSSIRLRPKEAELVKLFSNAWRYMTFAAANQFFMLAVEAGCDFEKMRNAMMEDYPRMDDFPKPGFAAGPCLFKDTMQLSAFSSNQFFMGHAAMLINEGLPQFVVDQVAQSHPPLCVRSVGILGMAFKAECDDIRDSLSYKLRSIFSRHAGEVLSADLYVKDDPTLITEEELIERSDIVVIGVPHRRYREMDMKGRHVIDIWGITR